MTRTTFLFSTFTGALIIAFTLLALGYEAGFFIVLTVWMYLAFVGVIAEWD